MIKVEINNEKEIIVLIEKLSEGIENRSPLMRKLSGTLKYAVDQNFLSGGRPKWQGLKYRQGSPLIDTGILKNSIQQSWDNNHAAVGTNLEYAPIHQFGGKTKPHKIKPTYKKALAFNGGVFKSVNHPGSNIPARPFLSLTTQDENDLQDDIQEYFRNLVK